MKNEYIIINRTSIEKRIEELEKDIQYYKANIHYAAMHETAKVKLELENLLSQSTPLIPEIEKAFEAGRKLSVDGFEEEDEKDYRKFISQLKLPI